jgi:pimeloyl-ACP methyl ester carboxylesterase
MSSNPLGSPRLKRLLPGLLVLLAIAIAVPGSFASRESSEFSDHTAVVDGHKVHYLAGGQGPILLMLHGFTLTGEEWLPLAEEFLSRHTVILPDLPGHGSSSPLPGAFSFKETARLMHGLLDRLGADKAQGIGHSAGAMTLLHMAVERPQRLESLALVGGPTVLGPQARKIAREDKFELMDLQRQEFYWRLHPGGKPQVDWIFRQYNGLADNQEGIPMEVLTGLSVKTLIIWGDRDEYFPLSVPLEMYRALPHAALWVVPGQGHMPLWESFGGSAAAARMFPAIVDEFFGKGTAR